MSNIENWFSRPFLPKEMYESAKVLPVEFMIQGEGLQQQMDGPFLVVPFVFSPYIMHRYSLPYFAQGRKKEKLQMAYADADELFCCELFSQDGECVSQIQYGAMRFEREHLTTMLRHLFRQADETFKEAQQTDAVVACAQHYQQQNVSPRTKRKEFDCISDALLASMHKI